MEQNDKYKDFTEKEIISLIQGIIPDLEDTLKYEKQDLMQFTGNQWNEDWDWNIRKLSHFPKWWLIELYENLKQKYDRQ